MESEGYKYYWDNDPELNRTLLKFERLEDLEKITINGLNAKELLNKQKIDLKITNGKKSLSTPLYDRFGEIIIEENNEVVKKIRIAPWKLSKGSGTPNNVFNYVSNEIFHDINKFLSYVIKNIHKDIKSIDNFSYQLLNEFPKSYDFLVNLLDYNYKLLENSLFKLYQIGPIHKETMRQTDYTGSKLILTSAISPSPYNFYVKKQHSHDTLLNQMMFQSAYFMMHASKLIESHLGKNHNYLKTKTDNISQNSRKLLNKYNLWSFYSLEFLDDSEIRSKLISLNNPFYMEIYKVFKIIRDIITYITLIAALRLEKGVEMALNEFFTIYEIWSVAKLWENFQKQGFELESVEIGSFNLISAKMYLKLIKENLKVKIIWEMHLDAFTHSTYYGGLISSINEPHLKTTIKPDITVIIECDGLQKVLIGDVKFKLKKGKSHLPKLESLYKVLSYMEDLKRSSIFEGFKVEGLLVYPGNMVPAKTPIKENENYINVVPLNIFNQNFDKITEL